MKKVSLILSNCFNSRYNIFYRILIGEINNNKSFLPAISNTALYTNNRNNSFMKNIQCLHKTVWLLIASLFFTIGSISAQIINEGFEEPEWQSAIKNPNNNSSSSGSVVINALTANSIMTYYTSPSSSTQTYSVSVTSTGTGTKSTGTSKYTSTLTSTGLNTSPNSGTWWYSKGNTSSDSKLQKAHSVSNSWQISAGGYVITPIINTGIATVTFWVSPAGNFFVGANTATANPMVQGFSSNSTNNGYTYGVSTYPVNGTNGSTNMQSFSYSTFLTKPVELGFFNASGNSIYIDDINISLNQGTQATVTTGVASSISYTTTTIAGTITENTPSPSAVVISSGVCYSSSVALPDTTVGYTTDGSIGITSGTISSIISGLTPNTHYYARAYAITTAGIVYASNVTEFTTIASAKPSVTTAAATNILSNKATVGGNIPDSGGLGIIQKGVCWSTTSGAETATSGSNFTNDGIGSDAFLSLIKSLKPSTTYYVMAYAINSLGITYGNEISFTTSVPGPVITASTTLLNFPTVLVNSSPKVLSYSLSGANLSPAADSIRVTPPEGFLISTSSNGGFITAPSILTIPYSSNTLSATKIYVKPITSLFAANNSYILHSGGGATDANSDTVFLTGNVIQDSNILTNLGTDFWVGHGLEEHMSTKSGYGLQLYIATGKQAATVKVSIPGIPSFAPQYITIDTNTVQIVSGFPTGDASDPKNAKKLPDARLYYTGISNRAIHVEVTNNVPVALFLYDYATNNSAGGSMVFPTNTWNSSYIVQTYGGASSNQAPPNTYFFVMAKEDNTKVYFTPTVPIIDSASSPVITGTYGGSTAYPAGVKDSVILNRGQVFNALGIVDAGGKWGISEDLTGTTVTSDCGHPISVFAGNSRTLINAPGLNCTPTQGSDNLIQQMFPKVAWGTKYLSVPTKTMEYNLFRIGVQDTTTIVTVDDSILDKSTLNVTGLYYQIEGNTCKKIVSNKPVTVTQFILPGKACADASVGNNGTGDPEMILLSPVQQSIKSTTVYTSDFKDGKPGGAYINVVIPTSGVASFRLDTALVQMVDTGTSSYVLDTICNCAYGYSTLIPMDSAFKPFPQDPSYSWAKFHVSYPAVHTLSSAVGFNAIAYGVADGESWGYNAGTTINDLTAKYSTTTPYGSAPSATTCKGNTTWINISLPYDTSTISSIEWKSANDASITPANHDTSVNKPVSVSQFVQGGATFHTYQSPIAYTFDSLGTFNFTVTVYGTFSNDCGGSKTFNVPMVIGKDATNFSFKPISCGSDTIKFTDITKPMPGDTITKWQWNFNNTGTLNSTKGDTFFVFPSSANYPIKLRVINHIGCFSDKDSSIKVKIAPTPVAAFVAPDSICIPTNSVNFSNKTTSRVTDNITYSWNFGDGIGTSTNKDPNYVYSISPSTSAGFTVKLTATSSAGCSATASHLIAAVTQPVHSVISSISSNTTHSILVGELLKLSDNVANGIWGNTNPKVASLDSVANEAIVKGLTKGLDTILYIVPARICSSDTAIYPIKVDASDVFMPNLFTPDISGPNSSFYIRGSTTLYKEVELWVFSSWGNQVFHTKGGIDDRNIGWDGNYNGKPQPSGVYAWVARLIGVNGNVITQKGSVTLLR